MKKKIFIGFHIENLLEKSHSSFDITIRNQKEYLGIFFPEKTNIQEILDAQRKLLSYFQPFVQKKDLFIFTQLFLG